MWLAHWALICTVWPVGGASGLIRQAKSLFATELIAEGEKMERIIEYLDPAGTHKNVVSVVSGISPEQKARVLKLLSGEK